MVRKAQVTKQQSESIQSSDTKTFVYHNLSKDAASAINTILTNWLDANGDRCDIDPDLWGEIAEFADEVGR